MSAKKLRLQTADHVDFCLRVGFLGFDIKSRTATIWDSGAKKWSTANLPTVGKAVVGVLSHPAETKNRYVWIESFCVSQNEVLAALEKATGEKWQINKVATEDQIREGREGMAKGVPMAIGKLIVGAILIDDEDAVMDFSKTAPLDNEVLGLPKEDLQTAVDAIVKESF